MAVTNQFPDRLLKNRSLLKVVFQCLFLADRHIFQKFSGCLIAVKVHAPVIQFLFQMLHEQFFIGSILIHLIHKQEHRNAIAFEQPPECSRMSLYSICSADDQYGIVQHLQCPLHLCGKIRMARCVQQCYFPVSKGEFCLF